MAHIYEKNDRKMSDLEIIKKTWPYVKPYAWKLVGVLLIMLLMIALDLASSILPGTITSQLGVISEKFIETPNLLKLSDMYITFALCITALYHHNGSPTNWTRNYLQYAYDCLRTY
mgnify:CR=1 FL=1